MTCDHCGSPAVYATEGAVRGELATACAICGHLSYPYVPPSYDEGRHYAKATLEAIEAGILAYRGGMSINGASMVAGCAYKTLRNALERRGLIRAPKSHRRIAAETASRRQAQTKVCETCGAEYRRRASETRSRWSRRRYCSGACASVAQRQRSS